MSRQSIAGKGWLAQYAELVATWRSRLRVHEDTEDAMQDAVLRILENDSFAAKNPKAYLKRSVRNGLIDRLRRQAVLPILSLHDLRDSEHPVCPGSDSNAYSRQMIKDLKAALDELPLACQQVYVRHRLEGWSHAEIAQAMGISRAMVEKHMTRALRHLTARLQKYAP